MEEPAESTVEIKKPAVKKTAKKPVAKKADTYGIKDIAKELKKDSSYVRVLLRKKKVKKNGKTYSWKTKNEMEAVIKQLK